MARRPVPARGFDHGLSAYTNYGCKCDVCSAAALAHRELHRDATKVRNAARGAAYRRLAAAHRAEFDRYYAEELARRGNQ